LRFNSKLPDVGTTIFTLMSRRALEEGALNIGQGFPDYCHRSAIGEPLGGGGRRRTQSVCADGGRGRVARTDFGKTARELRRRIDPHTEITVTCGGTEALYDAIQAVVGPGDEAIIFDPAYDAYEPAVRLAGGRCVRIALTPPAFASIGTRCGSA